MPKQTNDELTNKNNRNGLLFITKYVGALLIIKALK